MYDFYSGVVLVIFFLVPDPTPSTGRAKQVSNLRLGPHGDTIQAACSIDEYCLTLPLI